MDKWLERVLFVNIIMLLAFIHSDYVTWMGLVVDPPIPVSSNSEGTRAFYAVFLATDRRGSEETFSKEWLNH